MKRSLAVKMMYPIGCLVTFRGEEWLSALKDAHGIVIGHDDTDLGDAALQIMASGRVLDILCDEFEDEELEAIDANEDR